MFDDLGAIFYNYVIPEFDEYVQRRDASVFGRDQHLRAALAAASALFHFLDHVKSRHGIGRTQAQAACPDFRLVADVANVAKHSTINRPTPGGLAPLVTSASDVTEVLVITRYEDADGEYSDLATTVFAKCTDGSTRNLDESLTNVLNYWASTLKNLKVTDCQLRSLPVKPGERFVTRGNARNPTFEILRSIRLKQRMLIQKYDPVAGTSSPMDLTNATLEMFIYRPAYTIDISVKSPSGDRVITCSIELDGGQSAEFRDLTTERQRSDFVKTVLKERSGEVRRLLTEALAMQAVRAQPNMAST